MSSKKVTPPKQEAQDGQAGRPTSVHEVIYPVGLATNKVSGRTLVVNRNGAALDRAVQVPLEMLVQSRSTQVQQLFLKEGYVDLAAAFAPKELSTALMGFATSCKAIVINEEGPHSLEIGGEVHRAIVKGGHCHWIDRAPAGVEVVLVGKAAVKAQPKKDLEQFNVELAPLMAMLPRWLMMLLVALAAPFFKLFGVQPLSFALIGPSSIGKSIIQKSVAVLANGDGVLKTFNTTEIGLHDYLCEQGAQAVFFDDAHGEDAAAPLFRAVMDVGNGGGRMRSRLSFGAEQHQTIQCVLIVSAERSLMETARAAGKSPASGVFARILEIFPGAHGMFEVLGDFKQSADLARHIEQVSPAYAGVVGDAFVKEMAAKFAVAQRLWHQRRGKLKAIVRGEAKAESSSGVNDRVLESLAFCAFIGHMGVQFGVLGVGHKAVNLAVSGLFQEHLNRLQSTRTPVGQAAIEAVRHFILTNPARFLPIEQAADPVKPNQLAGYFKRGKQGGLFLFFPGTFTEKFVDTYGSEIYDHLRMAQLLEAQPGRHNRYLVRVPAHGVPEDGGQRMNFVAVRERILFEGDD